MPFRQFTLFLVCLSVFIHSAGSCAEKSKSPLMPKCGRLNGMWLNKFYWDFKAQWEFNGFACPSPDSAIVQGVYFLWWVSGRKVADQEYIPNYYRSVTGQISQTILQHVHPVYGYQALASAINGSLYIHVPFTELDPISAATVLVHEGRHLDFKDPSHVVCNHGIHRSKPFCDEKFSNSRMQGSGNNAGLQFLMNLYRHANVLGLDQESIRKKICRSLNTFFNSNYEKSLDEYSCQAPDLDSFVEFPPL